MRYIRSSRRRLREEVVQRHLKYMTYAQVCGQKTIIFSFISVSNRDKGRNSDSQLRFGSLRWRATTKAGDAERAA